MAEPNKPSGSYSNPSSSNNSDKTKDNQSSASDGLNPNNMIWATKYHFKEPNEPVILQFDDALMRAIGLKSKNKGGPTK